MPADQESLPRGSLPALFKQYNDNGYWKVRVIQKHRLPASWRHLIPAVFVGSLLVLLVLSPVSSAAAAMLLALAGVYLACNLVAASVTAGHSAWVLLPALPFVFACYHIGYGFGFLKGIVDFIVFRRGATPEMSVLTR